MNVSTTHSSNRIIGEIKNKCAGRILIRANKVSKHRITEHSNNNHNQNQAH